MIEKYRQLFTHLSAARVKGGIAPHKAILLLSVIELIEFDILKQNRIILSTDIKDAFSYIWKRYIGVSPVFKSDISQPFWYMKSEPFWHLYHVNGSIVRVGESKPTLSAFESGYYAELDQELYDWLHDMTARATLRVALIVKYLSRPEDIEEP